MKRTISVYKETVVTATEQHLRILSLINDDEFVTSVYKDDKDSFVVEIQQET